MKKGIRSDQIRSDRGATRLRPVSKERERKIIKRSFSNVFAHCPKESVVMKDVVSVFACSLIRTQHHNHHTITNNHQQSKREREKEKDKQREKDGSKDFVRVEEMMNVGASVTGACETLAM